MDDTRRLALMIDGDNAQAALLPQLLAEVSKYGTAIVRRVYGDWTEPEMKSWKVALHTYALQPVQQFRYTVGKNATDSTLIIDAMDVLYSGNVDGFCIVSSDSDYTRLATRIRESSLFVVGVGRADTPRSFVNACDVFVFTENLNSAANEVNDDNIPSPTTVRATTVEKPNSPARLKRLFRTAYESAAQDDGWAHLAAVGSSLRKLDPSFDPRTYGYKQLLPLIEANRNFIETRKVTNKAGSAAVYVRLKEQTK